MINKAIYNYFTIQTIFYQWINKNPVYIAIMSFYDKLYNRVKKTIYQIKPEPISNAWCNTVYIKSIYYTPNNTVVNSNLFHVIKKRVIYLLNNILLKNKILKKYFTRKWDYFENFIDLDNVINADADVDVDADATNADATDVDVATDADVATETDTQFNIVPSKNNCSEIFLTNETIQKIKILIPSLKKKNSITSELSLKLFILKLNRFYFTKIVYEINPQSIKIPTTYKKSNVKFMTIEYVHSLLKTPILIDLSEFNFTIESEILSFLFVYWYLKRKYGNWVNQIFDLNYKLNIIDSDFNMFQLKFYNFILLNENDYNIKPYV
jgi:hypothetical protein